MVNRKTTVLLVIALYICACAYQETASAEVRQSEGGDVIMTLLRKFTPQRGMKAQGEREVEKEGAGKVEFKPPHEDVIVRPLKFLLTVASIVFFIPRIIFRFIYTIPLVIFLTVFECRIFPYVRCFGARVLPEDLPPFLQEGIDMLSQ